VKRKKYTKAQITAHWRDGQGKCWRCKEPIRSSLDKAPPAYGTDWVLGHCGDPHWLGGIKVAPEHASCNAEDAKDQTKLAAKSVRMQARAIGIPKSKGRSFNRPDKPKGGIVKHTYTDDRGRLCVRFIKPGERQEL
jgi:hypothetical protein